MGGGGPGSDRRGPIACRAGSRGQIRAADQGLMSSPVPVAASASASFDVSSSVADQPDAIARSSRVGRRSRRHASLARYARAERRTCDPSPECQAGGARTSPTAAAMRHSRAPGLSSRETSRTAPSPRVPASPPSQDESERSRRSGGGQLRWILFRGRTRRGESPCREGGHRAKMLPLSRSVRAVPAAVNSGGSYFVVAHEEASRDAEKAATGLRCCRYDSALVGAIRPRWREVGG